MNKSERCCPLFYLLTKCQMGDISLCGLLVWATKVMLVSEGWIEKRSVNPERFNRGKRIQKQPNLQKSILCDSKMYSMLPQYCVLLHLYRPEALERGVPHDQQVGPRSEDLQLADVRVPEVTDRGQ